MPAKSSPFQRILRRITAQPQSETPRELPPPTKPEQRSVKMSQHMAGIADQISDKT